jgi:hypothetical protein
MAMIEWEDRTPSCRAKMLAHIRHQVTPRRSPWTAIAVSSGTVAQLLGIGWILFR